VSFTKWNVVCGADSARVFAHRHSILIVDDDPPFRELYKTALRLEGFDVLTACDGIEALHIVEGPCRRC
jgi:DNA-binding NtrC family response regulator